jgi:hypothetical protein
VLKGLLSALAVQCTTRTEVAISWQMVIPVQSLALFLFCMDLWKKSLLFPFQFFTSFLDVFWNLPEPS